MSISPRMLRLAVALATLAPRANAQTLAAPLGGLDQYITNAMGRWGIPGLAIAVVKDDSVVYMRGFGVREVGHSAPVDANTVFAIGSNTKLFTAVVAGTLVDQGRMRWDDPVTRYLPGFQLYDPWVTREITIRDALSHRSGLGERGIMIAYGNDRPRAEVIERLRYLRPNTSFRSQFGYQNLMVLTAGEAAGAAAGAPWDTLIRRRIFEPLGMNGSTTTVRGLAAVRDVATPHHTDGENISPMPWRDIDNVGPAGSINSSVADMSKWVRCLLDIGRCSGGTLLTSATLGEIESPQTIVPMHPDTLRPSTHFSAYGLGVGMYDYRGVKVLTHDGGIDGMLSSVTLVPERHLGIVVLTNADGHNQLMGAIPLRLLDAYLGAPVRDWSTILLARFAARERALREVAQVAESKRPRGTHTSLPQAAYRGRYTNEMYGDVLIDTLGSKLVLRIGSITADLEHWALDSYKVVWRGPPNDALGRPIATFVVGPLGSVEAVTLSDDVLLPPGLQTWENDRFIRR